MTALLEKIVLRFTEVPLVAGTRRNADTPATSTDRSFTVRSSGAKTT